MSNVTRISQYGVYKQLSLILGLYVYEPVYMRSCVWELVCDHVYSLCVKEARYDSRSD